MSGLVRPASRGPSSGLSASVSDVSDAMQPESLGGAVLAGGASRRMGRAKQHVMHEDGRTLAACAMELVSPLVDVLVVAGPPDAVDDARCIPDLDHHAGLGPLAGIEAVCRSGLAHRWLIVPCDMPELAASSLRRLVSAQGAVAVFGVDGAPMSLPICLDADVSDDLARYLDAGDRSIRGWLSRTAHVCVEPPPMSELRNINAPSD